MAFDPFVYTEDLSLFEGLKKKVKEHLHVLCIKSITKKQLNKCMTEIQGPGRIQTSNSPTKNQYHNNKAKENSL